MRPGRVAQWLLRVLAGPDHTDDLLGDLEERYLRGCAQHGESRARQAYRRDVRDLIVRMLTARLVDRKDQPVVSGRGGRRFAWTTLGYDLRLAVRALRATPLFAVAVVLTLSLGIGANVAILSGLSTLLFRPLGYPDEHRLAVVSFDHPQRGLEGWETSYQSFLDLRDQATAFELAGFTVAALNLQGRESAERIGVARVSANFWSVAGVAPAIGRSFTAVEDQPGGPALVVLSHELWARQFGSDTTLVGAAVSLNGNPHTVIGVMPRGFRLLDLIKAPTGTAGPTRIDAFVHLASFGATLSRRARTVRPLARFAPDADLRDLRAELETLYAGIAQSFPFEGEWVPRVAPLREQLIEDVRPAFLMALGAATLILLLACVNISSLVLVRGTRRQSEMAVRLVLGGRRRDVIRQFLVESSLLGLLGGVVGAGVGVWLMRVLTVAGPDALAAGGFGFDPLVVVFALGLSICTSIAIGIVPAVALTKRDPSEALRRTGTRVAAGTTALRAFVIAEVALALTLLTSAGHLTRSFGALAGESVGHRTEGVLTFALTLSESDYPADRDVARFVEALVGDLVGLSVVERVAGVTFYPPRGPTINFSIPGHTPRSDDAPTVERQTAVTPAYFDALDIPLIAGRVFTAADDASSPGVVVISEALARKYFGDADPVGRPIVVGSWRRVLRGGARVPEESREIVGVVGDVREVSIDGVTPVPMIYQPHAQDPWPTMTVMVQTAGAPANALVEVRAAVTRLDRSTPLYDIRTIASVRADDVARERFLAGVVGGFATLAVILAAFGIYAVIAYTVSLHTREIGIRLALGARPAAILGQLMKAGGVAVGVGLVIGTFASAGTGRILASLLFRLSAGGVTTVLVMMVFLSMVAAAAVYLPARRVAALDAARCLRVD